MLRKGGDVKIEAPVLKMLVISDDDGDMDSRESRRPVGFDEMMSEAKEKGCRVLRYDRKMAHLCVRRSRMPGEEIVLDGQKMTEWGVVGGEFSRRSLQGRNGHGRGLRRL